MHFFDFQISFFLIIGCHLLLDDFVPFMVVNDSHANSRKRLFSWLNTDGTNVFAGRLTISIMERLGIHSVGRCHQDETLERKTIGSEDLDSST